MTTWLNGASVNRDRPRAPMVQAGFDGARDADIVRKEIERAVERDRRAADIAASLEKNARLRQGACAFLDKFIRLFTEYSHSSRYSHRRQAVKESARSEEQIIAELNDFYNRRPRPWRWHGNSRRRGRP